MEELQEASSEWDQEYYRLSSGRFKGRVELTQIGDRHIFRERWDRKIRYVGTAPTGGFGFALPFELRGEANWVGAPVGADTVVVQTPGHEADMISPDAWDALTFSVPEDEVLSIVAALSDQDPVWMTSHTAITLTPEAANRLRTLGWRFLHESRLAEPEDHGVIARASQQLVKLLLWELIAAQNADGSVVEPHPHADIVRLATELVLSDPDSLVGLTDICADLDVSLRSLHNAFQDVTGMSPATWLRRIRLNKVHKALLRASPEETQVKGVALENGFLHFGHFGQQYKRLFGRMPSHTLCAS